MAKVYHESPARAQFEARDPVVVDRCNGRFVDLIGSPAASQAMAALRGAETIGRPLGSPAFLDRVATQTGAIRDRRGPKPAANKGFSKVSP